MEDEEANARRSSRGRNPLPKSVGPLFPPLPPKQSRDSPRNSPQTALPSERTPLHAPASFIPDAPLLPMDFSVNESEFQQDLTGVEGKPELPNDSVASLTPPPPVSEDVPLDVRESKDEEAGDGQRPDEIPQEEEVGLDDWSAYHRNRAMKSFSTAADLAAGSSTHGFMGQEEADQETPGRTRAAQGKTASRKRATSRSFNGTPTAPTSTSASERGESVGRLRAKKRRGEEQLLLDDHLLPVELRQTASVTGKRERSGMSVKDEPEEIEEMEQDLTEESREAELDLEAEAGRGDEELAAEDLEVEDDAEGDDDEEEEITRCVCQKEDGDPLMIQCDSCNVWQHGPCVGIWGDDEAPDEYFCEECRPDLHGPLKRWIRSKGRNIALFIPPMPEELQKFHNSADTVPTSQSKRWAHRAPMRPLSRSHHRKDPNSPAEGQEARREPRSRQPSGVVKAEKVAVFPPEVEVMERERKRAGPSEHHRKSSLGAQRSRSPSGMSKSPPPGLSGVPKRRSTMNSRDAAYEEAVKAAIEASRREMLGDQVNDPELLDEAEDSRDLLGDGTDALLRDIRGANRDRGDEEADSIELGETGDLSLKPKHPNQYTYRFKPLTAFLPPTVASPARRAGGTPVPTLPPPTQHEHGTRRAGAIANNLKEIPYTAISVDNLRWFVPDHLSSFADLLPSRAPAALEVRSPRQMSFLARNHFHNQRYGPFSEHRDSRGKLELPSQPLGRGLPGEMKTHLEPPTRTRYPVKRITTTEMRKRVRNMLEYVSRGQIEEGKRKERARLLGIDVASLPVITQVDADGDTVMGKAGQGGHGVRASSENPPKTTLTSGPSSAELLDELSRQLVAFQESYAAGVFATPFLPHVASFPAYSSAPVTPALPSNGAMETQLGVPLDEEAPFDVLEDVSPADGVEVYRVGLVTTVVTQVAEQEAADTIQAETDAVRDTPETAGVEIVPA